MYTYNHLLSDLSFWESAGAQVQDIGVSVAGRRIPSVRIGSGAHPVVITAAIHAREHITAKLVSEQIYRLLTMESATRSIVFVPMCNPDGVTLCQFGLGCVRDADMRKRLTQINGGSEDFSLWKANLRGVDLNVNFDARWGTGAQNVTQPSASSYIGTHPHSEPETAALVTLLEAENPCASLSYHAKGHVIYWDFYQTGCDRVRDHAIAKRLAAHTGYELVGTSDSAGGFKDYCIEKRHIPSFTLETVSDDYAHPIPSEAFATEWTINRDVPTKLCEYLDDWDVQGKRGARE